VGTVCTVGEQPAAGFVAQPAQTAPAIVGNQTQTVTFVNTRTPAPTGSLAVVKQAPPDAQSVPFSFVVDCPGAAGSPFLRTVTGSGTTPAVDGVPVGTVCTVGEQPVPGFVAQPAQTAPAIVGNQTQTVTFVNTRMPRRTGSVAVVKRAPANAQNATFTFSIACPGMPNSPFTRTVTGSGTSTAVDGVPAGTVCTATEQHKAGFADQPSRTFPAVVAGQTVKVTIVNRRVPRVGALVVCKAAAPGVTGTFTFHVAGRTVAVAAGQCSGHIALPPGTVTVTEAPRAGTAFAACAASPGRLVTCNLPARTADVRVVAGSTTTLTVTNRRA
jgi:hypothetical protein